MARDSLFPNVLSVQPDGTILAELTGHLKAAGVDLLTATGATAPADRRVRWLDETTDIDIGDITTYESGGLNTLQIETNRNGSSRAATYITAGETQDSPTAALSVQHFPPASPPGSRDQILAEIFPATARVIIDDLGRSNFAQWAAAGAAATTDRYINAGNGALTWGAGQLATVTITHGLPGGAYHVYLLPLDFQPNGFFYPILTADQRGPATFRVNAFNPPGAPGVGTPLAFAWLATTN